MTEQELEVSRQLVLHPNFKPEKGMVFLHDGEPTACQGWTKWGKSHDYRTSIDGNRDYQWLDQFDRCLLDISHPATKGCLLELARELHKTNKLSSVQMDADDFGVGDRGLFVWVVEPVSYHASEGVALAEAIMTAPTNV